jgi:hypothetical protein
MPCHYVPGVQSVQFNASPPHRPSGLTSDVLQRFRICCTTPSPTPRLPNFILSRSSRACRLSVFNLPGARLSIPLLGEAAAPAPSPSLSG